MAARRTAPDIRASGAVVWRLRRRTVQIAVVHRPHYDDWSLPKGKLHEGERELAAAVREVREETGSIVAVSRRLDRVRYQVGPARKEVRYWLARHCSGAFARSDEVDTLDWLSLPAAIERLSYADERRIVDDLREVPLPDSIVVLVRHAKAGKRGGWDGADVERPLDSVGHRQARKLAEFLSLFAPDRVVSAEPARCVQTVTPFAERIGVQVQIDTALGDAGFQDAPHAAEAALVALARAGTVSVVASQGTAIPGLIEQLRPAHRMPDTKKGSAWVLAFVDGTVISADHYPDAST